MLAPRASNAFVCLRCELTLTRSRLRALPRPPAHANFSASARRHHADDIIEEGRSRPQLTAHPLGRLRKRKGGAPLRAITARLEGTKTLGEDAAILVLREVGEARIEEKLPLEVVVGPSQDALSIAQALKEEDRPATLEEIVKQLDSLRPKTLAEPGEPHYVSQSAFVKLSNHLLRAFSSQQLSYYYSVTKGVSKRRVAKEVMGGLEQLQRQAKRPAERSEWHPGTTQINRRLPGLAVHKAQPKKISKHLLVDQILRDLWKLVLLEEIEAAGELELAIKDWQLTLLTAGTDLSPLDRIGRERRARLEVYEQDNVVRITADKNTAEYAADDVEALLQDCKSDSFDLEPWIPSLETAYATAEVGAIFPEEALREVASMTGALVQVSSKTKLSIRAFEQNTIAEVQSFLVKRLPLKEASTQSIEPASHDLARGGCYLQPVVLEKEAVPYAVRETNLFRWIYPVSRIVAQDTSPDKTVRTSWDSEDSHLGIKGQRIESVHAKVRSIVDAYNDTKTPENVRHLKSGQTRWQPNAEFEFSASFGHSLFSSDDSPAKSYFAPTTPGLFNVFSDPSFKLSYYPASPSLDYEFIAMATAAHDNPRPYPTLRIRLRPDRNLGHHTVRQVSLTWDRSSHDVLLPDQAVDIRFKSSKTTYLLDPSHSEHVQPFIEYVTNNIRSGDRLTAPNLEIPIPKWTINGMAYEKKKEKMDVKYLFSGVRFKQNLWGSYGNVDISYSTAQSGKLGTKGGELRMVPQVKREIGYDEPTTKLFVQSCFTVASKLTEGAAFTRSYHASENRSHYGNAVLDFQDVSKSKVVRELASKLSTTNIAAAPVEKDEASNTIHLTVSQGAQKEPFADSELASIPANDSLPSVHKDVVTSTMTGSGNDIA